MSKRWSPDIYSYLDYRKFLSDFYSAAKQNTTSFSFRYFSRRAGFTSPNFLKLVIAGQRNISVESVPRFAAAIDLSPAETRFFRDLVELNQAETDEERNAAFSRISASRRFRLARRLDHAFFRYLSRWYFPAIRELAARDDFRADPQWISEQLEPPIPLRAARTGLKLLFDLGLLETDADGRVRRGEPTLTTGHEVRSLAVANFHRAMIAHAATSIARFPSERRDISGMTVCVSADTFREMKQRIHAFREMALELCDSDPEPTAVYQLCIQLFPLSRSQESPS